MNREEKREEAGILRFLIRDLHQEPVCGDREEAASFYRARSFPSH